MTSTIEDPADEVVAWYTNLRETEPVRRDDQGIWHLFRHEDVSKAMFDSATFSSDTNKFAPQRDDFEPFREGNIISMDPPKHKNLRGLIVEVFTPKVVDSLAPRITEVTNQLLDQIEDAGGRFDLVDALTYQLPVIVIAELLGIPASDRPMFRRWADGLFEPGKDNKEKVRPDDLDEAMDAVAPIIREMDAYLRDQINRRRTTPTTDLMGKLVSAEVNGKRLTDPEIVGFAIVLLLAGHITTTALLGNSVYCFDKYPQAAADLRADRSLLPGAIEEVLRFRTPFPILSRATTTEVTLGGTTIPADQLVVPWLASANRDPAKFAQPDVFDIHRKTTGHIAFGHGIHFCIGSRLARLEARIALGILFDRYREIAVDHDRPIDFQNPWRMNTIATLPVIVRR